MSKFNSLNTIRTYLVADDNSGAEVFNTTDIVSGTETIDTSDLDTVLKDYLKLSGGTVTELNVQSQLYLNNEEQTSFTTTRRTILDNVNTKTQNMSHSGGQTIISGDTQIVGNLLLNNKLNATDIGTGSVTNDEFNYLQGLTANLQFEIDRFDANFASNQTAIDSINVQLTNHTSDISDNLDSITSNSSQITTNIADIAALQNKTQSISFSDFDTTIVNLKASNFDTSYLENITSDVQNQITDISDDIITLNSATSFNLSQITNLQTKADTNETKLTDITFGNAETSINNDVSMNDVTINSSLSLDGSFIISNNSYTVTNQQFGYLQNLDNDVKTDLTNLNNAITSNDNDITTLNTVVSGHTSSINILDGIATIHDTSLNSHAISIETMSEDIDTMSSIATQNQTDIATNVSDISQNASSIFQNTTDITNLQNSKQDELTSFNRLNASLIGDGSVSSLEYQTLGGINTGSTIQTQIDNNVTSLSGKQDTLNDTSNKLPISYVDYSSHPLQYIDITSNLQAQLNSINSAISSQSTINSTQTTNITNLQSQDSVHSGEISDLQTADTTLQNNINTKHNIIDASNRLDSGLMFDTSLNDTVDNIINGFDTSITDLQNDKQDLLNDTTNKLPASHLDLSGHILNYVDVDSSIQTDLTDLQNQINTLTGLQSGDTANFTAIDSQLDDIDLALNTKQAMIDSNNKLDPIFIGTGEVNTTKLNYMKNVVSDVQSQIDGLISSDLPSLTYDGPSTTTTISNTFKSSGKIVFVDDSEQTTAFTSAKDTLLNTVDDRTTDMIFSVNTTTIANNCVINGLQSTVIDGINTSLGTKQDTLNNSTNKLPSSHIDLTGSSLVHVDISAPLQNQLTTINNSLTALSSYDSSQTTLNNTYTSDITDLQNNKHNLIDASNRLSADLIHDGSVNNIKYGYLSNVTSDIQTQINSKQSTIDSSNRLNASLLADGSISDTELAYLNGTTSNIQTQLDSKVGLSMTGILSGEVTTKKLSEVTSNTYTFTSNVLTFDSNNGRVVFMNSLTSATNFEAALTNVNPNSDTYTSFTYSLIIDTASYIAYANTCRINGTLRILLANGGLSNVDLSGASAGSVLQQITVVFTSSGTTPSMVLTNISPFY